MAGTRFQVKQYGANIVAAKFHAMARRADDLSPAYPKLAVRVAAGYRRSFNRSGPGWAPTKPSTQRRRVADGLPGGGQILVATGGYREAASNPASLIIHGNGDTIDIAVDYELAQYHQSGTKHMPARPLKLSAGDRYWLIWEINESLMEAYHSGF